MGGIAIEYFVGLNSEIYSTLEGDSCKVNKKKTKMLILKSHNKYKDILLNKK